MPLVISDKDVKFGKILEEIINVCPQNIKCLKAGEKLEMCGSKIIEQNGECPVFKFIFSFRDTDFFRTWIWDSDFLLSWPGYIPLEERLEENRKFWRLSIGGVATLFSANAAFVPNIPLATMDYIDLEIDDCPNYLVETMAEALNSIDGGSSWFQDYRARIIYSSPETVTINHILIRLKTFLKGIGLVFPDDSPTLTEQEVKDISNFLRSQRS